MAEPLTFWVRAGIVVLTLVLVLTAVLPFWLSLPICCLMGVLGAHVYEHTRGAADGDEHG